MENTTCIIPTIKGRETLLERAIVSTTFNNFEEIIVVGPKEAKEIQDFYGVKFIESSGSSTAAKYNLGIKKAKTDYIMLLNDDDFYLKIPEVYNSDLPFIYSDFYMLKSGTIRIFIGKPNILLNGNYIGYLTVRVKKNILKDNPFDEGVKYIEDYEMWLRLNKLGVKFKYYPFSFAVHDQSHNLGRKTSFIRTNKSIIDEMKRIRRKYEKRKV